MVEYIFVSFRTSLVARWKRQSKLSSVLLSSIISTVDLDGGATCIWLAYLNNTCSFLRDPNCALNRHVFEPNWAEPKVQAGERICESPSGRVVDGHAYPRGVSPDKSCSSSHLCRVVVFDESKR